METTSAYKVDFEKKAQKQLRKMEKSTANIILSWVKKNLVGTNDPRRMGKALVGELRGAWRYRVGDYRLIADISDETITILILEIGHRREVYQ